MSVVDKHTIELRAGDVVEVRHARGLTTRFAGYRPQRGELATIRSIGPAPSVEGRVMLTVYLADGSKIVEPATRCSWYVHEEDA